MTRKQKCELAIEKGFKYNSETGTIINRFGRVITNKRKDGYLCINLYNENRKEYKLLTHQLAWYITYGEIIEEIDHINGVKDDNRIANLRRVTHQGNCFNRTTAKGYYWNKKAKKWHTQIKLNSKQIYLGLFDEEEDARQAYLNAKEIYHIT
jgi:hypothetical protein